MKIAFLARKVSNRHNNIQMAIFQFGIGLPTGTTKQISRVVHYACSFGVQLYQHEVPLRNESGRNSRLILAHDILLLAMLLNLNHS